ncbi:hypothetical protein trd_1731 [Thermomicrobium roseum DSM 5159]|uniref:Uncharacterized protein n=1 Tax=Thermomicrobium roseum (strain ATCC 27502 / DSM 5159 / P-2) TaxID=309801 RepID=B9L121_THERP|nr:hypothetical protein trd_1731 [Thermomicrobium roseum DSM 5159]
MRLPGRDWPGLLDRFHSVVVVATARLGVPAQPRFMILQG